MQFQITKQIYRFHY